MASIKELKSIQERLDIKKYEDSVNANADACGSYYYCKNCNKKNKYPCASAYLKSKKTFKDL